MTDNLDEANFSNGTDDPRPFGWRSNDKNDENDSSLYQDLYAAVEDDLYDLFGEEFPRLIFISDNDYRASLFRHYNLPDSSRSITGFGGWARRAEGELPNDLSMPPHEAVICRYRVAIEEKHNPEIGNGPSGWAYYFQRGLVFHWSQFQKVLSRDIIAIEKFGYQVLAAYRADYTASRLSLNLHLHKYEDDFVYQVTIDEIHKRLYENTGKRWRPVHFETKPINSSMISTKAYFTRHEISSIYAENGLSLNDLDEVLMDTEEICVNIDLPWVDVVQMVFRDPQLHFIDVVSKLISSGKYDNCRYPYSGSNCRTCEMNTAECWCYRYPA